jgi:uncharacterized protein
VSEEHPQQGAPHPPPYPGPQPGAWPAPQPFQQPVQQWAAWPQPGAALPSFPHPAPRPYHQMLLTWNYRWWKPLAGMGLFLALFLAVQVLAAVVLVLAAAVEGGSFTANLERLGTFEKITPALLLVLNLSLAAMILVSWLTIRVVHRMRPRWLTSVAPKMRWKFFFACVGLSAIALVAQLLVGLLLPGDDETAMGTLNDFTTTSALLALVVLLTTPLQAAGEEYAFRGYLLQAIGSFWSFSWAPAWLVRWIAIVATATLFALAHGVQNFPLFFDRFMFGLIAGWLVTYTGGLEAGIALHILNNFLAFGLALSFGDVGETLTVSEVSWWNIVLTLTQSGIYTSLVVLLARRMHLRNTTAPPSAEPDTPVPSAVPAVP